MRWIDYNIESFPDGSFTVQGDWPGEVMGLDRDGNFIADKKNILYKPGDVFIVDKHGILKKQENLTSLIFNYELKKNEM